MSSPTKYEESGKKYDEEPEIVAEAVPAPGGGDDDETPVPAGHSRFYCNKCHTVSLVFSCEYIFIQTLCNEMLLFIFCAFYSDVCC